HADTAAPRDSTRSGSDVFGSGRPETVRGYRCHLLVTRSSRGGKCGSGFGLDTIAWQPATIGSFSDYGLPDAADRDAMPALNRPEINFAHFPHIRAVGYNSSLGTDH